MANSRLYKTEAIILRRTDLGEADRILTLYTPQLGKIRAVAKGVRKTTSRLAGHIELLALSSLLIARAHSLDIITQAQTVDSFLSIRDDLLKMSYALHVGELVDRFTEQHIENYPLYRLLADTLSWLAQGKPPEPTLFFFEMQLLGYVGYRPELHGCVNCRAPVAPVTNFFSPAGGGVLCPSCARQVELARPLPVKALKVLRYLQDNGHEEVLRLRLDDSSKLEVDSVLRSYTRYLLEGEPKSTQFLDLLKKHGATRQGRPSS